MSTPGYQAPSTHMRDPTAVMGSRGVAWLVDAVLLGVILLFFLPTPLSPLATEYDNPNEVEDACEVLRNDDGIDVGLCLPLGDKAYTIEPAATVLLGSVELAYFLVVLVVWQGYTGMTPGKALLGLRTVGEDGQAPGMGKAFVRSLLWIVDGLPGIPLVGLIVAGTSTGHRRVGDMAAQTYVVAAADAGQPIAVPGATPSYQATPSYPGYGSGGYQTGAGTAWSGQAGSPVAGTPSPTWGAQQQQSGYPVQPPTADASQGYGSTAPYQAPTAEPSSPYGGTPSPYGQAPGAPAAEPTATYGTPAAETPSPYGGTPAAEPSSPYGGTPAEPAAADPASPYGGTPAEPGAADPASPFAAPTGHIPSQPEQAASEPAPGSTAEDRPVTWPPVVPSPESIGMPASDAAASDAPAGDAEPAATEPAGSPDPGASPWATPAEPESSPEPAASPWSGLAAPSSEPAAAEPPTTEPPATESPSPASELADLLGSSGPETGPSGAEPPTTETGGPGGTAEGGSGYKPQWDAARGAYIQWDPNRQRWLQWDDTTKEWNAI